MLVSYYFGHTHTHTCTHRKGGPKKSFMMEERTSETILPEFYQDLEAKLQVYDTMNSNIHRGSLKPLWTDEDLCLQLWKHYLILMSLVIITWKTTRWQSFFKKLKSLQEWVGTRIEEKLIKIRWYESVGCRMQWFNVK